MSSECRPTRDSNKWRAQQQERRTYIASSLTRRYLNSERGSQPAVPPLLSSCVSFLCSPRGRLPPSFWFRLLCGFLFPRNSPFPKVSKSRSLVRSFVRSANAPDVGTRETVCVCVVVGGCNKKQMGYSFSFYWSSNNAWHSSIYFLSLSRRGRKRSGGVRILRSSLERPRTIRWCTAASMQ